MNQLLVLLIFFGVFVFISVLDFTVFFLLLALFALLSLVSLIQTLVIDFRSLLFCSIGI